MSIFCTNFPVMDCPFRPDCRPSPDGGRAYQEQKMNGCRLPSSRSAQRWIRFSCHPRHRGAGRFAVPLFSSNHRAKNRRFPTVSGTLLHRVAQRNFRGNCDRRKNWCPLPFFLSQVSRTSSPPAPTSVDAQPSRARAPYPRRQQIRSGTAICLDRPTLTESLCDGVDVRKDADRGGDYGCNSTDDCGYSGDRTPTAMGEEPGNPSSESFPRRSR